MLDTRCWQNHPYCRRPDRSTECALRLSLGAMVGRRLPDPSGKTGGFAIGRPAKCRRLNMRMSPAPDRQGIHSFVGLQSVSTSGICLPCLFMSDDHAGESRRSREACCADAPVVLVCRTHSSRSGTRGRGGACDPITVEEPYPRSWKPSQTGRTCPY